RRKKQKTYNKKMGITPETVRSNIKDILGSIYERDYWTVSAEVKEEQAEYGADDKTVAALEAEMKEAAAKLEFERAAKLRDRIKAIRKGMLEVGLKGS
ncbi:excinuclease ABC subunit B, partial [Candidatus Saccharibacteria bacterium]|nr:excinuclease ABC subunit B [Candidatus Saccharibacteria bacterium]